MTVAKYRINVFNHCKELHASPNRFDTQQRHLEITFASSEINVSYKASGTTAGIVELPLVQYR